MADTGKVIALIKAMAGSGADPAVIKEAVEDWLAEHVDPDTGYVIDDTFSIPGAAPDAKLTGDELNDLKSALNNKLDKAETNPNGISISTTGFDYGIWKANLNVGDTVTTATNNNCRRKTFDLSAYIGGEVTIKLVSTLNPQVTNGTTQYFCNSSGVIGAKAFEKDLLGAGYTFTITADTAYLYLSYTYANFTSISITVNTDTTKQFAKINTLEAEMEQTPRYIQLPNLCENANIDDTTGFSANSAATFSAADHVLTITPSAKNSETDYSVPTPLVYGHKYYAAVDVKSSYTGPGLFARLIALKSGSSNVDMGSKMYNGQNPNAWQRLAFVTDAAPDYSTFRLKIYCTSTGLETIYIKQIVIIDLTAIFGAGNEPNAGAVDEIIASANDGDTFYEGTLETDTIIAQTYPNAANDKPMFVGISGYVMNVNAKYSADKDIRYKVGKAGSNSLFNWRGFDFIDNSTGIVSSEVDLAQAVTTITDWFGPHKLKAANNVDGDMPDSDNFTGGNHAYNGDSSGTPTARTASYAFYVDGRKVTSYLGYAYYVDVYWENRVQATNTKKEDGTGREVLKETFHMHFDGDKWTVDGMLEPLEALSSWSYYGLQMSRGSGYSGYIFYHDCPDNRTWHATNAQSSAGANTCHTVTLHDDEDFFEMHIGSDGLGNFALNPSDSSFFSSDSKTYSNLVKGATNIAANSVFTFDGYYKWYDKDLT